MFKRSFLTYLNQWKISPTRKPLVIRGARQVGKTFVVQQFAKSNYSSYLYINLDKPDQLKLFESVNTVEQFVTTVNIAYQQNIKLPNTLVFIDEIQNLPNIIALLRYFYEEMPQLHVICAGSLLEVRIHKEGLAMPVGRVEYGYMHPLTFFEFLDAVDKSNLRQHLEHVDIKNCMPLPQGIHALAVDLFRQYTLLGGMPEVLSVYQKLHDIEECKKVLTNIATAYAEDTYKYATTETVKYLTHILTTGPRYAGSVYKYENFGESAYKSREMVFAFDTLEKAMLLRQIKSTNSVSLPIVPKEKRAKKLIWLDVGFVNTATNSYQDYLNLKDLDGLYQGRIAEQIVGQNILASGKVYEIPNLYFWAKDRQEGIAEVDFCLQVGGRAMAVEVKSGMGGKARSLKSFGEQSKDALLVKVSEAGFEKRDGILHLPFYLINRIFDLV